MKLQELLAKRIAERLEREANKYRKPVTYSDDPRHMPMAPTGRPDLPSWLKGGMKGSLASKNRAAR